MNIPLYIATSAGAGSDPNADIWTLSALVSGSNGGVSPNQPATLGPYLWTWDLTPAGPSGVCVFRGLSVTLFADAGFSCFVQPVIDGVPYGPGTFFLSLAGGEQKCDAQMDARGSRISAQVSFGGTIWSASAAGPPILGQVQGQIELRDITCTSIPIRAFPA